MNSLMPMSVSPDGSMIYESNGGNGNSAHHHHHHGGFPLEFKPHHHHQGLNFSFEGFENNSGLIGSGLHHHHQGMQLGNSGGGGGGARMLFPIEDLKHVPSTTTSHEFDQQNNRASHGDPSGFWNGMLGGGAW